jgi:plastocyanin
VCLDQPEIPRSRDLLCRGAGRGGTAHRTRREGQLLFRPCSRRVPSGWGRKRRRFLLFLPLQEKGGRDGTFLSGPDYYPVMPVQSRLVILSGCIAFLMIACITAGCTSSQTPAATAPASQPVPSAGSNAVTIKNFAFDPSSLTVKTGTEVTWTNLDSVQHTVVSDTGSLAAFSSDPLPTGASYRFTFTKPGTYTYHCSIHPSMKGTVIVK